MRQRLRAGSRSRESTRGTRTRITRRKRGPWRTWLVDMPSRRHTAGTVGAGFSASALIRSEKVSSQNSRAAETQPFGHLLRRERRGFFQCGFQDFSLSVGLGFLSLNDLLAMDRQRSGNSSLMQPAFAYPFRAAISGIDTGHSRASESSNMRFIWGRSHFRPGKMQCHHANTALTQPKREIARVTVSHSFSRHINKSRLFRLRKGPHHRASLEWGTKRIRDTAQREDRKERRWEFPSRAIFPPEIAAPREPRSERPAALPCRSF
jgi:hypothetical protein